MSWSADSSPRDRGTASTRLDLVLLIAIDHRIAYAAVCDELDDLVRFWTCAIGKLES